MAIVIVMLALWGNPIKPFFGDSFEKVLEQDFNFRGKASLLTEFQTI